MLCFICIIMTVTAMIGFSLKNGRNTWPEKLIGDTTGVFQNIFHTPAEYFAGFYWFIKT